MLHDTQTSIFPLTSEESEYLEALSCSRSASVLRARRAAMLLQYVDGVPICEIARTYRTGTAEVERGIDKALRREIVSAREGSQKKRGARAITKEMVEWVRELSCQNPRNLGYSCVEWPASLLAQHVRDHCRAAGHHALAGLSCADVDKLLARRRDSSEDTSAIQFKFLWPDTPTAVAGVGATTAPGRMSVAG